MPAPFIELPGAGGKPASVLGSEKAVGSGWEGRAPGCSSGSAGQHTVLVFFNPLVRVLAQGTASLRFHPCGSSIQLTSQGGATMGLSQLLEHAPSSGVTRMPASGGGLKMKVVPAGPLFLGS